MAEITEVPGEVIHGAGSFLTKKIGPLPVWGWAVGLVIVGGGAYLLLRRSPAGGAMAAKVPNILGQGTTGGLGGGGGSSGSTTTPTNPLTNAQWLNNVVGQVSQQLQIPASEAQLYLQEWLNGNAPVGTSQDVFNKVVAAARAVAEPPSAPSSLSPANYFGSNQQWLASILQFLPGGTPGSVQTELTNLINGTTTTISQQAANALQAAQGIVGTAPQGFTYTVTQPSGGTAIGSFTDQLAQDFFNLGSSFDQRVSFLMNTLGLNQTQAGYVAQATHITYAQGGNVTTDLLNQFIANAQANKPLPPNPGNK